MHLPIKDIEKIKLPLVIGGGSGHEPLFTGYCGAGLADAVACGNVCASPNPELIMEAAKAVDQGKGVLFVYGNYAGDNLNFDMAEEMCQAEGMKTAHVVSGMTLHLHQKRELQIAVVLPETYIQSRLPELRVMQG